MFKNETASKQYKSAIHNQIEKDREDYKKSKAEQIFLKTINDRDVMNGNYEAYWKDCLKCAEFLISKMEDK